jgi:hypothetical protein
MLAVEVALKGNRQLNLDKIKFDGEVESKLVALPCSDPAEGRSIIYADANLVTLTIDNLSSPKIHNLYKILESVRVKAIRDYGSWLNIAECEWSVLSRQAFKQRFASKEELENK